MTTRRKWLLVVAFAAVLLATLAATTAWLVLTGSGLARAVAALESVDALGLRVEGERGRLAGPLHVDVLELHAGRVSVIATDIDLDWSVSSLAFGRVKVSSLRGASARVEIGPATAPPTDSPVRFMPRWLSLGIARLELGQLDVALPNGTRLDYHDVRVAGQVTHVRIELDEVAADAGAWAAAGSVGLVAGRPLRLRADVEWTIPAEPALAGALRARGDLGTLEVEARIRTPVVATAGVTLSDLDTALRWEGRIESEAVDLSAWLGDPLVGPLAIRLDGKGSLHDYALTGRASGQGLPEGGIDVEARLGFDSGLLTVETLGTATPDGGMKVVAQGQVALGAEPRLDLQAEWSGLAWPLAGPASFKSRRGRLDLTGWRPLGFSTDAAVSVSGLAETSIVASGEIDTQGVAVQQATLSATAGSARARGYLGFGPARPWTLEATVAGLDLAAFREGLDSDLGFGVEGSGAGVGTEASWAVHLGQVQGQLRGREVSGAVFVAAQAGNYDFSEAALRIGPATLALDGRYGADTALNARLDVPDLGGLLPGTRGSIEAQAKLRSTGTPLADRPNLAVDISARGRDLEVDGQRAAVLSADAVVDLTGRETSWVRVRGAGIEVGGQRVTALRLSLDGFAREHSLDLRVGVGDRAASLVGTGRYGAEGYELTGERIESNAPRLNPYQLEAPMQLVVQRDAVRLDETCLVYAPRRICAAADWDAAQGWSATLSVAAIPVEALRMDLPRRPAYRGRLDGELHARGEPGSPWTADATATLSDAALEYATASGRMETLDLGTTRLRVDSLPDRHALFVTSEGSEALQLRAEGTIGRADDLPLGESPLRGWLELRTTRLGLLPLLVPEIDSAGGELRADLTLGGTPGQVVAGGNIVLEGGELDLYRTNLRLRGVEARLALLDRGLELEARGRAGDGRFDAGGSVGWAEGTLRGQLRLQGERLLVADVPEARVEASPDLTFAIAGQDIAVKGLVTIPAARIEPKQLVGAVLPSADARLVGTGATEEEDADGYRVSTDVRLTLGKNVRIDAFGLRGRLEGSVVAQTRPDEVATASGELEIEEGKYQAYSKELEVERGRLLFAGGPVAEPGVDLRAIKKVPGYQVGVIARGRLRRPELSLFSEPSMPQSQIASLLLVGRRLDNLDAGSRSALGGSRDQMAAEGGALLAGQLGRFVGIDEVSLESEEEEEQSLVIGKYLSPRLYVSYGVSLTDAINTFKLRYTIGDRWVVSVESGQESSADVEYTIDR